MLKSLEKMNGQLLYNVTQQLKAVTSKLSTTPSQIIPAMQYVINADNLPLLTNVIDAQISR